MAVSSSHVARRPLTPPIVYLGAGVLLGPIGLGLIDAGWREHGRVVETLGELLVALALFCIGLRLRQALEWRAWRVPVRLSTITTVATATLVAGTAHVFFDLDFAHALLLGAILAPTDPVLARDVPLPLESDTESVRTTLVGEGALNQAVALSVLLFALGLTGLHELGPMALRWAMVDVVWAFAGGAAFGWLIGAGTVRLLARLDRDRQLDLPEELFALAALVLACGGAAAIGSSGPLAALAAGLALGNGARLHPAGRVRRPSPRMLGMALRLERAAAIIMLVLVGVLLARVELRPEMFLFALVVLGVVRPIAVRLALGNIALSGADRRTIGWFGVRGMGSVYLLAHGINEGLGAGLAHEIAAIALVTLLTSVVLHGLSATSPLGRQLGTSGRS
ncbi:MAG: cation:proton antiporter [Pseudomonadota bacterium]|jgi:NhaP-type Na+/H+ and K+/H+ antiporters|nr:MAG: hypothetical protein DIU56_00540 [Pseudomonadota bacterium]